MNPRAATVDPGAAAAEQACARTSFPLGTNFVEKECSDLQQHYLRMARSLSLAVPPLRFVGL